MLNLVFVNRSMHFARLAIRFVSWLELLEKLAFVMADIFVIDIDNKAASLQQTHQVGVLLGPVAVADL